MSAVDSVRANGSVRMETIDAFVASLGYDPARVQDVTITGNRLIVSETSARPGITVVETSHLVLTDEQNNRRGARA